MAFSASVGFPCKFRDGTGVLYKIVKLGYMQPIVAEYYRSLFIYLTDNGTQFPQFASFFDGIPTIIVAKA